MKKKTKLVVTVIAFIASSTSVNVGYANAGALDWFCSNYPSWCSTEEPSECGDGSQQEICP